MGVDGYKTLDMGRHGSGSAGGVCTTVGLAHSELGLEGRFVMPWVM